MRKGHLSIAGMMVVVAVVAIDCLVLMTPATFAGGYLIGLALQVAFAYRKLGGVRWRRFRAGFEATGWALLMAFLIGHRVFNRAVAGWPAYLYASYRRSLSDLSPEAVEWLLSHIYVLDPNDNLTSIQMIGVLEMTWGLTMLLLALASGLVARGCSLPIREDTRSEAAASVDR